MTRREVAVVTADIPILPALSEPRTRMTVDEVASHYADLRAAERRAMTADGTGPIGPVTRRTQFALFNFDAVLAALVDTAEELARLKAAR